MRRLLWNVYLHSSRHTQVQLLRVLHRYPRRPVACAVPVAAATAVASATALAASRGELHRLPRHLQRHRPDMRRPLWTFHLRSYSQHPQVQLLRVLHRYRRRPVAAATAAAAEPKAAVAESVTESVTEAESVATARDYSGGILYRLCKLTRGKRESGVGWGGVGGVRF